MSNEKPWVSLGGGWEVRESAGWVELREDPDKMRTRHLNRTQLTEMLNLLGDKPKLEVAPVLQAPEVPEGSWIGLEELRTLLTPKKPDAYEYKVIRKVMAYAEDIATIVENDITVMATHGWEFVDSYVAGHSRAEVQLVYRRAK